MSWLFSRALVEAFSEANSSAGEPCAPLNVMPTPHKFWRNDKTMEFSKFSQFGLRCAVLTEDRGKALLTSFLAASRARTSAPPGREQDWTEPGLDSGLNLHGSLARFDPDSCSWKTPQCSLLEGLDEFSETWPAWGSMRNGVSWGRTMPVLRTSERGSGFWPTPTANQFECSDVEAMLERREKCKAKSKNGNGFGLTLANAVKMQYWPTPTKSDGGNGPGDQGRQGGLNLRTAVQIFPTPCARDYRSPNSKPFSERGGGARGEQLVNFVRFGTPTTATSGRSKEFQRSRPTPQEIAAQTGGQLNPEWVCWLMGWPRGWTDLGPLNPQTFREWQQASSIESTA